MVSEPAIPSASIPLLGLEGPTDRRLQRRVVFRRRERSRIPIRIKRLRSAITAAPGVARPQAPGLDGGGRNRPVAANSSSW